MELIRANRPLVERLPRTIFVSLFSFRSTTSTFATSKRSTALMTFNPIEPAPPITQTDFHLISVAIFSLFAVISLVNMLTGREAKQ